MQPTHQFDIHAQFENETLSVSPFASAKMGLQAGQTAVKVDAYNIVCVPFRLSMKGAVLLASFSQDELTFFKKYTGGLAGLTLIFQPANAQAPLKIFARCVLNSIEPMKGRESVGLIGVEWKPCPPDLVSMLGDYFMLVERLKAEYEDYRGKMIQVNADTSKLMGYNNYAVLGYEKAESKIALFSLASDRLSFLLPMNGPALEAGKPVTVKLFFRSFQFALQGSVAETARLPSGVQKASATVQFSPELVSIIEAFRFAERVSKSAPQAGDGA